MTTQQATTDTHTHSDTLAPQPIVRISNVSKIYGIGDTEVRALDDVSIDIQEGEFIAIVGASGSGKSTLINIIGCLDTPTTGEYHLDGEPVADMSKNQLADIRGDKIGFVFQTHNLLPRMSALANVEMPMIYGKWNKRRQRATQALETVGLKRRMHHKPTELSGGEQQRVGIARALVKKPRILLADEPTGNLDSATSRDIIDIVERINREDRITVIIVTHEPDIASRTDRVVTLSDGSILSDEINIHIPPSQ